MINRDEIVINSSSGHVIKSSFLYHSNKSNNLAILFPGGDNSTDIPTLHYARKAALLCGCDVLSLEYGFNTFTHSEILDVVTNECEIVINRCLEKEYKQIFFISKSMGHFFSLRISSRLGINKIKHISYTPLYANIGDLINNDCIVFTGTKDKWMSQESRDKLSSDNNVELVLIENAVHSLEINDDYIQSIKILELITNKCFEYIKRNRVD